jgi:citrate lyase subunit beta/citryl-CoA lyase
MSTSIRLRSLYAVPMDQPARLAEALASEADALMADLTDLVAMHRKDEARENTRTLLSAPVAKQVWVRIARTNDDAALIADLDAAVQHHVTGLAIPECAHPDEIRKVDALISALEAQRGIEAGSVRLLPLPEGALAIRNYFDTLLASKRVVAAWFPGAPAGDLSRDVGFIWSEEGSERLYMRSKVVLDARAAGIEHILDSGSGRLGDLETYEREVHRSKSFGFTARMTYSAEHAVIVNRVLTPTAEEVAAAQREIVAYEAALERGVGLFELDGRVVDVTTVEFARRLVARAAKW